MHDNLIENYDKHLTDNGRIVFLQDLNAFPKKSFLKSLPKWKADITIQNKIEKLFYNGIN